MPDADPLSETKACELIARIFRGRGYDVIRNVPFREYGVAFHIDGWDPRARIGFEFLTSEDEDHDDLTLTEYKTLMAAQQRGELSLFVIDEVEPLSSADLRATVEEFLDAVADAAAARSGASAGAKRGRAGGSAGRPAAAKSAAGKRPARKPSAGKAAARPAAKKKTVGRRQTGKPKPGKPKKRRRG